MAKLKRIRVRKWRGKGFYLKRTRKSHMFSSKVRKLARKHKMNPDKSLKRSNRGTWRRGDDYLVWNKGRPRVITRKKGFKTRKKGFKTRKKGFKTRKKGFKKRRIRRRRKK